MRVLPSRRGGKIFDENVEGVALLLVTAVGAYKCVLSMVEIVQETVVERKACTKYGAEYYLVCGLATHALT